MTPVPARPCGGCERNHGTSPVPCFVTTRPLRPGSGSVQGRRYVWVASSAMRGRRANVGAKLTSFAHRTESPGLVLRRGRRYLQTGCRRIIPSSSHRVALGDRVNQMGGTIPSLPPVSTGKPVTPRCQWSVVTTCTTATSSGDVAPSEWVCQGLIPGVLPRKCAGAERAAIRCEYASSENREGWVKAARRKNADVRKKKMPPPVPCRSSFGNPLIEKGASRVSFGSHYSLDDERRGWACKRHSH